MLAWLDCLHWNQSLKKDIVIQGVNMLRNGQNRESCWFQFDPFQILLFQRCTSHVEPLWFSPAVPLKPKDSKRPSSLCDNKHRCYPCLISYMHATLYGEKCAGEKTWNIGVSRPVCFRRINDDRHSHTQPSTLFAERRTTTVKLFFSITPKSHTVYQLTLHF